MENKVPIATFLAAYSQSLCGKVWSWQYFEEYSSLHLLCPHLQGLQENLEISGREKLKIACELDAERQVRQESEERVTSLLRELSQVQTEMESHVRRYQSAEQQLEDTSQILEIYKEDTAASKEVCSF